MRLERRAVVFDMDDTLYPFRRFVTSGSAAVASYLSRRCGVDRREALRVMLRAARGPSRGRELQACLERFGLSDALLPALVSIVRHHAPALSLPRSVAGALRTLRRRGWRLGVVTNGPRAIQARKAAALDLARHVDAIVYATEHGSGAGKPDPEPFQVVLGRLCVSPPASVFVGDDEICDIAGAGSAGLSTVRCLVWRRADTPTAADAVIREFSALPSVADRLFEEAATRYAA